MKTRHVITGLAFWVTAVAVGWTVLRSELSGQSSSISRLSHDVSHWLIEDKQCVAIEGEYMMGIALNDPIFYREPDGRWQQVGLITNINDSSSRDPVATRTAEAVIYNDAIARFPDGYQLDYHTTPTSLDWVVKTMIPPERQAEIATLIMEDWKTHQLHVAAQLRPVLKEGIRTALKAVEDEVPNILRSHRGDFRSLGDKYETEILKAEIVPLVKEEILPLVEEEALPVAEEVGRALWQRVSVWGFTWRFLYDKSPLPQRDAVRLEFQRFVNEEALPELRSRTDQFVEITETIIRRAMENPRVKDVLKRNMKRVAEDPELHRIVWTVTREAVVENATLRRALEDYLRDHETKAAMRLAGDRLEPTVRHIGDLIFGTREGGITPEFSRILRSQILTKDRRWFVLVPDDGRHPGSKKIVANWAAQAMTYPMGFGGQAQSPLTPSN